MSLLDSTSRPRRVAVLGALVALSCSLAAQAQPTRKHVPRRERPVPQPAPLPPAPAPAPPPAAPATQPALRPGSPASQPANGKVPVPTATTPTPTPTPAPLPGVRREETAEDMELYRCKKLSPSTPIKVTLKPETELKDLITWAMSFTCRNFIYGSALAGRTAKVTVIAPAEMTPREAWKIVLVALQTMNLTVVPKGEALEIVETQRAKEEPLPIYKSAENVPAADQIVRAIIRPDHVAPEDLTGVLTALKSKDGVITPLPASGMIVITDQASIIKRMTEVVKEVNQPLGAEKIYIVYIQNADASEMAKTLSDIFNVQKSGGGGGGAAPAPPRPGGRGAAAAPAVTAPGVAGRSEGVAGAVPSKIIADPRTNSLIIIASERAYARILALIRRLDVPVEGGEGTIHVYYLSNADAESLAGTLNTLITGQQQRTTTTGAGGRAGAPAPAPAPSAAPGAGGQSSAFEGTVRVTHDKPTNALVIVSSAKDYLSIREVIRKLDQPRRQVFVNAIILEVSLDKTRKLGVAWHGGDNVELFDQQAIVFGGVEHPQLSSLVINPDALLGLAAGIRGPEIEGSQQLLGISVPAFGVQFQLLQSNNDVNVISSPHLLTTDNEEAEFVVGQNIPYQSGIAGFPSGAATGAAGTTTTAFNFPLQSIQRQDVALKLKMKPHITEAGSVRLDIDQEISDILSQNFGGLGPSWSKRSVKTTVVVNDQQPVVIGGLMSDKETRVESKVPLLGDIPILGYLFKFTQTQKQKTNLLILLTPYIIKDQSDMRRIYDKKVRDRKEFIEAYTSFEVKSLEPNVDYRRKRGLLEEIDKAVLNADEEQLMIDEAKAAARKRGEEGPVELPPEMQRGAPPVEEPLPLPPPPPVEAP